MTEPEFLSFAEAVEIHAWQIEHFGGAAGLRDLDLLKSALAVPMATYGGSFLHADLWEMAAAYLFHLVENHPFVDGNKRLGAMAALVFLELNGVEFTAPADALTAMVFEVAKGKQGKREIAAFLRRHSRPVPPA